MSRVLLLSDAMRRGLKIVRGECADTYFGPGNTCDALGAAFLGSQRQDSPSREPEVVTQALLWRFPQLWASVRYWPGLAAEVEAEHPGVVPPVRKYADVYRQAIHPSLFRVITELHGKHDWSTADIAALLGRHGL